MKKRLTITLSILGFVAVTGVYSASTLWRHRNVAVDLEEQINAQYNVNQSNYDNMWKRFKEITQISDIQAEKFKYVYQGLIEGRYKDEKLIFKSIQENNPQLDTKLYSDLQREVAASRREFANDQQKEIDVIREYNTYIRKYPIMTYITHREKIDETKYYITSNKTQDAFKNKKDDAIDLREDKK